MAGALLASLPPEVAGVIFSFIPLKPRLIVVSIVCKRWRQLVLRMITELPPFARPNIGLYPRLSTLSCPILFKDQKQLRPIRCPASIDTLITPVVYKEKDPCLERLRHVPSLRSISISYLGAEHTCDKLVKVLRRSRETLHSITISQSDMQKQPCYDYLLSHYFPSLTSLSISGRPSMGALITTHASQLVSLRFYIVNNGEIVLPAAHFVNLTSLTTFGHSLSTGVLDACPHLKSLDILAIKSEVLAPLLSRLTKLQQLRLSIANKVTLLPALATCGNLRYLSFENRAFEMPYSAATMTPLLSGPARMSLTELCIQNSVFCLSQVAQMPNLNKLLCSHLDLDCRSPTPALRSLRLENIRHYKHTDIPLIFEAVPSLGSLDIPVDYPTSHRKLAALLKSVNKVEQMGLPELRLALVLYAQGDKSKSVHRALSTPRTWNTVTYWIDDESSETEETTASSFGSGISE